MTNQQINFAYRTGTSDTVYRWFHFDNNDGTKTKLKEIDISQYIDAKFIAAMSQEVANHGQNTNYVFFLIVADDVYLSVYDVWDSAVECHQKYRYGAGDFPSYEYNTLISENPSLSFSTYYHLVALKDDRQNTFFYTGYVTECTSGNQSFSSPVINKASLIDPDIITIAIRNIVSPNNESSVHILIRYLGLNGDGYIVLKDFSTQQNLPNYNIFRVVYSYDYIPSWLSSEAFENSSIRINKNSRIGQFSNKKVVVTQAGSSNDYDKDKHCHQRTDTIIGTNLSDTIFSISNGRNGQNLLDQNSSLVTSNISLVSPYVVNEDELADSSDLQFTLDTQSGFMQNPCEVNVREFDVINFERMTTVDTMMSTWKALDPLDTTRYQCSDNTYPTLNYDILINSIEDTSTFCTGQMIDNAADLQTYVQVQLQAIKFLKAELPVTQWSPAIDCHIDYSVGYDSNTMTIYQTLFDVTCSAPDLPEDWEEVPQYFYQVPQIEQIFQFSELQEIPSCSATYELWIEDSPGSDTYQILSQYQFSSTVNQLFLDVPGTQDELLNFKYVGYLDDEPNKSNEKIFSIDAKYCPMILPSFESEYVFDLDLATELVIPTYGAENGSCGFSCSLSQLPGEPYSLYDELDDRRRLRGKKDDESPEVVSNCPGLLVNPSTDLSLIGAEHTFTFTLTSDNENQVPKSTEFMVKIIGTDSFCESSLYLEPIEDITVYYGDSVEVLLGAENGDCRFELELQDSTNTGISIDPNFIGITKPVFRQNNPFNQASVYISIGAKLQVSPTSPDQAGVHNFEIVIRNKQDGFSSLFESIFFKVIVLYDSSIPIDCHLEKITQSTESLYMKYALGAEVEDTLVACSDSKMTIKIISQPSGSLNLPQFLQFDASVDAEALIRMFTEDPKDVGTYRFDVREVNMDTEQVRVTEITLEVYDSFGLRFKDAVDLNAEPLVANILSLSHTGNLTIAFNKSIKIPPIDVYNDTLSTLRSLEKSIKANFTIDQVIDFKVDSSFYSENASEIMIKDYKLTRVTEKYLDIHLEFEQPDKLAISKKEPDILLVSLNETLTERGIFVGKNDFSSLTSESLKLDITMVRQYTKEQFQAIQDQANALMNTMDSFSIANLALNLFLSFGFKYLWKMVTLLQFVIFIRAWLILLPEFSDNFIKALKSLALFEFLPTEWFKGVILGAVGLNSSDQNEEEGEEAQQSESFYDKLAVFIIAGVFILFILLILGLLRLLISKCPNRMLFSNQFVIYNQLKVGLIQNLVVAESFLSQNWSY